MATNSPTNPDAAPETPEAAEPLQPKTAKSRMIWPLLNLFILGVLLGQVYSMYSSQPRAVRAGSTTEASKLAQSSIDASQDPQPQSEEPLAIPTVPANMLQLADALIMEGNAAAALKKYEALKSFSEDNLSDAIRFRIGLCSEAIANFDRALHEYRTLISNNVDPRIDMASQLGQARIWYNTEELSLVKESLCRSVLQRSASRIAWEDEIHGDFVHLLAHVLGREAVHEVRTNLLADADIAYPRASWSPARSLQWLTNAPAPDSPSKIPAELGLKILYRFGPNPDEFQLEATLPSMPVEAIVELLAQRIELVLEWSGKAKQSVLGRSGQIAINELNAAVLLDALLCPLDLYWTTRGDRLLVGAIDELDASELKSMRIDMAERLLRYAISAFPEHEHSPTAYVLLGNIAFDRGEYDAATALYQQMLRQFPRTRISSEAHFNQAKTFLASHDASSALESFYRVADHRRGHVVEPISYLFAGRLLLEDGEPKRAISPLSRAVSKSAPATRAVSIVTLAGAYLLAGNPHAANQLLMEHRLLLRGSWHHDQAAFLSALARYRSAHGASRLEANGYMLVSALSNIESSQFFGGHNFLLLAQAYRELELHDQMAAAYENGLQRLTSGVLRDQMIQEFADHQCEVGNLDSAKVVLAAWAEGRTDRWGRKGLYKVAQISFSEGLDSDCLSQCRQLLETTVTDDEKTEILKLMGSVYQRQRNYYDAALCFSGLIPAERPQSGEPSSVKP